jgi:prephenate dehydratase
VTSGSVAYQGVPGAFSHEACRTFLPEFEPVAHDTFEATFEAVASGACAIGLIPIENSTAGPVPEVARLLPASGLKVGSEHALHVRLQLMALPGARVEELKVAASHPMALAQCTRTLKRLGVSPEPAFDTAGAARDLVRSGDRTRAAVASRTAAHLYGLTILRENVEDRPDNVTRFVVVAR